MVVSGIDLRKGSSGLTLRRTLLKRQTATTRVKAVVPGYEPGENLDTFLLNADGTWRRARAPRLAPRGTWSAVCAQSVVRNGS